MELQVGDTVIITPKNHYAQLQVSQYGTSGKIGMILEDFLMIVNLECEDVSSETFKWGYWLKHGDMTINVSSAINTLECRSEEIIYIRGIMDTHKCMTKEGYIVPVTGKYVCVFDKLGSTRIVEKIAGDLIKEGLKLLIKVNI